MALGLIFAPFTYQDADLRRPCGVVVCAVLPWLTPRFFKRYGGRPSELEAKYLLLLLFGMGALAAWAGSEAVLPAYMIGMVLAGTVGKDHALVRRLRTLTFGLLTPFYFIRAGSFVSVPALVAAPLIFLVLLRRRWSPSSWRVYPATQGLRATRGEEGDVHDAADVHRADLRHASRRCSACRTGSSTQAQYSYLVATVIASAVIPTLIANAFFLPRHLLRRSEKDTVPASTAVGGPTPGTVPLAEGDAE